MNYPQSQEILDKIKSANKILLNCHQHPDADSLGSSLSMYWFLKSMKKEVNIVCVDDSPPNLSFLPGFEIIQKVDFSEFDYSSYDLFIILDTSSWDGVCVDKTIPMPDIPVAVIDHHKSNRGFGAINLVDSTSSSNCEVLSLVFEDCGFNLDRDVALCLLTGIIGDTGSFQFHIEPRTLEISARLMKFGIDKDEITFNLYKNLEFANLSLLGEVLAKMKFDKEHHFVWSAIPYEFIKDYPEDTQIDAIDIILQSISGTDFGIRMIEKEKGFLRVSFRARTHFDTSQIAFELGGGGHKTASGARVSDLDFEKAVEKVLEVARKYAKTN